MQPYYALNRLLESGQRLKMKISSRDVLELLRIYKIADDSHVPRHMVSIKISHPLPSNTVVSFCFLNNQYYALFDESIDNDINCAEQQLKKIDSNAQFELINNPRTDNNSHAISFKGKDCYLFITINNKKRLDVELSQRYPETSRNTWQKHIKTGNISVNGNVVKSTKYNVSPADQIAINIPEKENFDDNSLPIIYLDDHIIVINKPIGILSHSKGVMNDEFTVADFFKRYSSYNTNTNRTGIVHRLDRDTSGIMIGARDEETAKMLQKQFADRKTKKTYVAIVLGAPKLSTANIDLPIIRNPAKPSTFKVDASGKTAATRYDVIDSNEKYSLIKLQPKTGRTHQLRVHMNYIGTPIMGDRVYGKEKHFERLYLHAYSLEITIPGSERKTFIAPIPDDFSKYFSNINL